MIDLGVRSVIRNFGCDDAIILEDYSYDDAIIGISNDGTIVYDYDLMVESLVKNEDMNYEEAMEWIDYNTLRAIPYLGDKRPVIMTRICAYDEL